MEHRTLSSRLVYENRWMRVREDDIERDDGSRGVYGVVDKPDYVVIIPIDSAGLHLVEQFRYPVGARYWEFPQGSWEAVPDVAPDELARAELAEETGLRAGHLRNLGHLFGAYGFCSQRFHVYVATDLEQGEPARAPEEQGMRVARFDEHEVHAMIRDGAIRDAPSIAAYGLHLLSRA